MSTRGISSYLLLVLLVLLVHQHGPGSRPLREGKGRKPTKARHVPPPRLPFSLDGQAGCLRGFLPSTWRPRFHGKGLTLDLGGHGKLRIREPERWPTAGSPRLRCRRGKHRVELFLEDRDLRVRMDGEVDEENLTRTIRRWARHLRLRSKAQPSPVSRPTGPKDAPSLEPDRRDDEPCWPAELWTAGRHGRSGDEGAFPQRSLFETILLGAEDPDVVLDLGKVLLSAWHAARGEPFDRSSHTRSRMERGWYLPRRFARLETSAFLATARRSLARGWPLLLLRKHGRRRRALLLVGLHGDPTDWRLRTWSPSTGLRTPSLATFREKIAGFTSCEGLVKVLRRPVSWLDPEAHPLEASRARKEVAEVARKLLMPRDDADYEAFRAPRRRSRSLISWTKVAPIPRGARTGAAQ